MFTLSSLQAGEHLVVALADELLLDCVDAWQGNAFEHFRDYSFKENLTFLKLFDAWILDTALSSGVVDFHFVRCILVCLHAVSNQVDIEVAFIVLGYLDIKFDVLRHGKVIGSNLIEFVEKLTSSQFRHFRLIDSDLERLLIGLPRECLDCALITLVAIFENLQRRRTEWLGLIIELEHGSQLVCSLLLLWLTWLLKRRLRLYQELVWLGLRGIVEYFCGADQLFLLLCLITASICIGFTIMRWTLIFVIIARLVE